MPAFIFFCPTCNLRFEKVTSSKAPTTTLCLGCRGPCQRTLEGQSFSHAFEEPANPTNSGVHSYQSPSADMAVGRDAHKKWAEYEVKKVAKEKMRQSSGHHALTRTLPDVNGQVYAPMDPSSYGKRVKEGKDLFRLYEEGKKTAS